MNALVQLSIKVYAALLRLYPTSFRMEFEEEMQDIFSEATAKAAKKGPRSLSCPSVSGNLGLAQEPASRVQVRLEAPDKDEVA